MNEENQQKEENNEQFDEVKINEEENHVSEPSKNQLESNDETQNKNSPEKKLNESLESLKELNAGIEINESAENELIKNDNNVSEPYNCEDEIINEEICKDDVIEKNNSEPISQVDLVNEEIKSTDSFENNQIVKNNENKLIENHVCESKLNTLESNEKCVNVETKQSHSKLNEKTDSFITKKKSFPVRTSLRDSNVTRKLSSAPRLETRTSQVESGRHVSSTKRASEPTGPPPNSPASIKTSTTKEVKPHNDNKGSQQIKKISIRKKSSAKINKSITKTQNEKIIIQKNNRSSQKDPIKNVNNDLNKPESIHNIAKLDLKEDSMLEMKATKSQESVINNDEIKRNSTWIADQSIDTTEDDNSIIEQDPTLNWPILPPGARLATRSEAPSFFIAKKNEIFANRERERLRDARERQSRRARAKSRLTKQRHMHDVAKQRRKQMAEWHRKRAEEQRLLDKRFQQIERRKRQRIQRIAQRKIDEMQQQIAREREEKIEARRRRVEEEALYQWFLKM